MRVRLAEIKLRPTGKKVRLERDVEVESLFIGRGPDNDVLLKGLTISLHQATIRMSDGRLYIEAAAGQEITVNGLVTTGERLGIGDKIQIGSWELRVVEPETGGELCLEYEEIDISDSERAALDGRTRLGVETGVFARRPLSWAGIVGVLVFFLVLPLAWQGAQSPWNSGPVSRGHAYIENDCGKCHTGFFRGVRNADCMECHHDTGRHAHVDIDMPALDDASCAACHLEHRGREVALADLGSDFCSDCHSDLKGLIGDRTDLQNASDFGDDHPPLRFAVVTDPSRPIEERATSVDPKTPGLEENSGLKFNHLRHVGQAVTGRGDTAQYLQCGACHQSDAGGGYMEPIEFETHCQDCHRLDFDSADPKAEAPHGDPAEMRKRLRGYYANQVLNAEVKDADAPRRLRLRRPGSRLSKEERELSKRWVDKKIASADRRFFDRPGTCVLCHSQQEGMASDGGIGIAPVRIQTVWVPGSVFSHKSHAPFACVKCHPAAGVFDPDPDADEVVPMPEWAAEGKIPYELLARDASTPASEVSNDILIPEMDNCRGCHSGANSWGGEKVPSPCAMCHPFHVRELGPMDRSPNTVEATVEPTNEGSGEATPIRDEDEARVVPASQEQVHRAPLHRDSLISLRQSRSERVLSKASLEGFGATREESGRLSFH